jgi:single-strand DNA-binding protein
MPTGDTTLTITGNLTADPELRFTATGVAVAAFTVAASRRVFDQETGQWTDSDTLFLRCSAWRDLAGHAAESLSKGMRVIVTGRLRQRSYETTEGDKRTVCELDADDIGPSLRWATAKVAKTTRDKIPRPAQAGQRATVAPAPAAGSLPAEPPSRAAVVTGLPGHAGGPQCSPGPPLPCPVPAR